MSFSCGFSANYDAAVDNLFVWRIPSEKCPDRKGVTALFLRFLDTDHLAIPRIEAVVATE